MIFLNSSIVSTFYQGTEMAEFEYDSSVFFFFFFFLLEYSCFTILCQFLLYSKVNQLYIYIYSLFFGFPSYLGHHRALSRVPCAIKLVLISYLFYTQQCIYVNPNLPIHPTSSFPPWYPYICSLQSMTILDWMFLC